ncbi:MAG: hypothetical protein WCW04_02480 [Candidatus Paceibacterota bacterium]
MEKNNLESTSLQNFNIESIRSLYSETINSFSNVFGSEGYIKHEPCTSLISGIDHSVRFIGSTTNVFKKYLKEDIPIPKEGYFLVQKCLRTRNTNTLFDDSIIPEWSSYFTAMGAIAPFDAINKLSDTTMKFLSSLKIDENRIRIDVSSLDTDLLEIIKKLNKNYKFSINITDEGNIDSYRHKYGEENISGRNFNISIKNQKTNEFKDIGNIILIEKNNIPIATEMGIGVGTLISKKFNLSNSIEASSISKIIKYKSGLTTKFSDTLSVVVVMLKEKITPGSRDKARLLRTNLLALTYFKHKLDIGIEEIKKYVDDYEKEEFGGNTNISNMIINYLVENEKQYPNTTYDFNWGKNN